MADNNPNDPAFPAVETHGDGVQQIRHHQGMTIRQFAAIEMAKGILASQTSNEFSFEQVSDNAIKQADTLLTRLEQVRS